MLIEHLKWVGTEGILYFMLQMTYFAKMWFTVMHNQVLPNLLKSVRNHSHSFCEI